MNEWISKITVGFWLHHCDNHIQYFSNITNLSSPDSDSLFSHADYYPPTPPQKSGFHRYQFMLFEQPPDTPVSLTEHEKSRGNDSRSPAP